VKKKSINLSLVEENLGHSLAQNKKISIKLSNAIEVLKNKGIYARHLLGELSLRDARAEALVAQYGRLKSEFDKQVNMGKALTQKLVSALNQQEILIKENMDMRKRMSKINAKGNIPIGGIKNDYRRKKNR